MWSRYRSIILVCCLSSMAAMAQEASPLLTESVAVQLALQHQPTIRAAQAEVGMAQARVDMARANATIQVSGNGLAMVSSMRNSLTVPGVMPQAILQAQNRTSLDLNGIAMYPLYTGGRISYSVRAAQLRAGASEFGVTTTRTQVAAEARLRFSDWRQSLAMLAITQDTVTAQTQTTQVTQQLFDVGKVPRFDVLRAQAALQSAIQQATNAQADVLVAHARFAQALGVPEAMIATLPADEPLPVMPTSILETALARRADLRAAHQNIAAAKVEVSIRKASYCPQLYAMGMVDAVAPADMGKSAGLTVGIVGGIPLIDGGRRRAEVQEATQGVVQAQALSDTLELQVRADVASAMARVKAARQNIETATAQIRAADESYTVAQARYAGGKGTIGELLDAQRTVTEARQDLVAAEAQYRSTLATLYLAMGVDIVEQTTITPGTPAP